MKTRLSILGEKHRFQIAKITRKSFLKKQHQHMTIDRSTPPPITDFHEIRLDVPRPITLSNGMPVWIAGNGEDEINKLTIYMTGGTFQESKPMQATTCSMAVFNGNKNMTYNQIAEAIDYYGAWRSLQTYDNCTAFSLSS